MATSSSTSTLLVALKSSFIILMCIMAVALAYLLIMDGYSSCFDPNAWWTIAAVTNVLVFFAFIVAWLFYKESSWMKRVVLMFMLFWCGGFVTCGYIVMLFFKLSPEESLSDPLYFVLVRRQKTDVTGHMRKSTVAIAKLIVTLIACCLLGIVIYACIIDGFPFYVELLTPCMITTLTDTCIHIFVFSVWIAYKESSWMHALLWILLIVCFNGIGVCIYIMRELFILSPGQHISSILFNKNRDMSACDPLLMVP